MTNPHCITCQSEKELVEVSAAHKPVGYGTSVHEVLYTYKCADCIAREKEIEEQEDWPWSCCGEN